MSEPTQLQVDKGMLITSVHATRVLGDISFTRNWTDYKLGFGSYIGDFWLGNEFVHQMTSEGMHQLRIDIIYKGSSYHAVYNSFRIEDEASSYTLRLGQHYGNAKDQLNYNKDMKFATYDRADNNNCATRHAGGWWFDSCHYVFLNGIWLSSSNSGVVWYEISGFSNSLCSVEMKFRKQL
ncbi:ficolin-2-like [Physella acuta]|uniref:ficolin-2-like n=1 Tax=Physella acuta TaxID=109671 RepID=UPI0027DB3E72|nr:ficolin-2-like [Physella acuta]